MIHCAVYFFLFSKGKKNVIYCEYIFLSIFSFFLWEWSQLTHVAWIQVQSCFHVLHLTLAVSSVLDLAYMRAWNELGWQYLAQSRACFFPPLCEWSHVTVHLRLIPHTGRGSRRGENPCVLMRLVWLTPQVNEARNSRLPNHAACANHTGEEYTQSQRCKDEIQTRHLTWVDRILFMKHSFWIKMRPIEAILWCFGKIGTLWCVYTVEKWDWKHMHGSF